MIPVPNDADEIFEMYARCPLRANPITSMPTSCLEANWGPIRSPIGRLEERLP